MSRNRLRFASVALASLALIALTFQSRAATTVLGGGTFDPSACTPCSGNFTSGPQSTAFNDTFTFSVTGGGLFTINQVSATWNLVGAQFNPLTLQLWQQGGVSPLESVTAPYTAGATSGSQQAPLPSIFINPGNYFLKVIANTADGKTPNTYAGTFQFIASAVPEPSTWAMMILGFLGLAFTFRQSRRKVSFA